LVFAKKIDFVIANFCHSHVNDSAVTFDIIFTTFEGNIYQKNIHSLGQLSYTIPITFTHQKGGLTRDFSKFAYLHSGVNDSAEIFSKFASLHSGGNDSAVHVTSV
jgi:hypothetical protein